MKKTRGLLMFFVLIVFAFGLTGCGEKKEEENSDFVYVMNSTSEYVRIVRYKGEGAEVLIPDTLNGKPVKEIGQYTFQNSPQVTSITIPAGVTKIEDLSFSTLPNLKTITVAEGSVGFASVDNVLYHKKMGTVYCYPQGKTGDSYTLPDSVKTINGKAFYNSQLREITMSGEVKKVLAGAFANSARLESVVFSGKLTQIFEGAFQNCSALREIALPASLTSIGADCFRGCRSLTEVTLPENVSVLESGAFAGCTALTSFVMNTKQVQRIAAGTFLGDTALQNVIFGTEMMGIAEYAFKDCVSLTSVSLTEKLTALGQEAFMGCTKLQDVTLPASLTQVGARVFEGTAYLEAKTDDFVIDGNGVLLAYKGADTDIVIPDGVKNISYLNSRVTRVTVPQGVVTLSNCAFENCVGLSEILLPATLESLGDYCFANCVGLKTFTIPAKLRSIGEWCFQGCSNMEEYTVDAANVNYNADQGVLYDKVSKSLIWYPSNSALTSYTMSYGPTSIGPGACQGARNLVSFDATAAEQVTGLSEYAFADCPNLKTVKLVNTFAVLGDYAFANCPALSEYDTCYTVTDIGDGCFQNCTALKTLTLESPITKIGLGAFDGMNCEFKVAAGSVAEEYVRAFDLKTAGK